MAECSKIVPYKDCSGQSLLTGLDLSGLRDVIVWCVSIEQQEEVSQRERVQVHTDSDRQYNVHGCSYLCIHRVLEMNMQDCFH